MRRHHALAGLRVEPPGALVDGALDEVAATGTAHDLAVGEGPVALAARPDQAVLRGQRLERRRQQGSGQREQLPAQGEPGLLDRPAHHQRRAARARGLVPRRRVGVGIRDDDTVDWDSQRVGRDLREHRSRALADLDRAREEACGAVLVQLDRGRRGRGRHRRLERAGDALAAHQAGRGRLRGPRPGSSRFARRPSAPARRGGSPPRSGRWRTRRRRAAGSGGEARAGRCRGGRRSGPSGSRRPRRPAGSRSRGSRRPASRSCRRRRSRPPRAGSGTAPPSCSRRS